MAGRPVDPSYLEISESTGGQLFLFQKSEIGQSAIVMNASHTHPATVLRAVGHLNGSRDFEFPVDSGTQSILILASLQCRNAVQVLRPSGGELGAMNSAVSIDLQAGRILRVDNPEPGPWKARLTGSGLFVISVLAKADTGGNAVVRKDAEGRQQVEVRVSGAASRVSLRVLDAGGGQVADLGEAAPEDGVYRASFVPSVERFRIAIVGLDAGQWPFQRTHPVLFRR